MATQARGSAFGTAFAVVAAGVAMSNLDIFVVDVALPDIGRYFGPRTLPRTPTRPALERLDVG